MSAQQPKILAIIGQGYVGLPLAMAAVDAGWSVIGVDNFEAKVAQINGGSSTVEDISNAQLQAAIAKGAYKATTDFSLVSQASVITICVPTPLDAKREPDLALLRSAATGIARTTCHKDRPCAQYLAIRFCRETRAPQRGTQFVRVNPE